MTIKTKYYIDYIYDKHYGANYYYQLVRTKDDAILYANENLDYVKIRCRELGIPKEEIILL